MTCLVSYWEAVAKFVNLGLSVQGHLDSSVTVRAALDRCVLHETELSVTCLSARFSKARSAEP